VFLNLIFVDVLIFVTKSTRIIFLRV